MLATFLSQVISGLILGALIGLIALLVSLRERITAIETRIEQALAAAAGIAPVGAENRVTPPDQRLRGRPGDRRPVTGDQHDRSLWPSDSPTSRSDDCCAGVRCSPDPPRPPTQRSSYCDTRSRCCAEPISARR